MPAPPPSELAKFLEEWALVIVGATVATLGALWLVAEEVRIRRAKAAKFQAMLPPELTPPKRPRSGEVVVVLTAQGTGKRLTELEPLRLESGPLRGKVNVSADPSQRYQTFIGIGGAFTESASDLLLTVSQANQEKIVNAYFRADTGIGYSVGRVHMNACDFSLGDWSCCDQADDTELKSFTIDRYRRSILPFVHRAVKAAGEPIRLLASPWSPPAWMKTTKRMCGGGQLSPQFRQVWANYYVRFAQELEREGVPLWAFTVQNEPEFGAPWESCTWSAEEELDFVRDHLGPAVESSGKDVKILLWDHNRDEMLKRAHVYYSDEQAVKYIWGVAFHWYGNSAFEAVEQVHDLRPDKHLFFTEGCQEQGPHIGDWDLGERYAESIISDLNKWCEGWLDWNLILDMRGGPNHLGNLCAAPVHVDAGNDTVHFQNSYFYIGHFSRYIKPGATRIKCDTSQKSLEATAFANPDGTIAVVVLNRTPAEITFSLSCAGKGVSTSAPKHSIATYVFLEEQ